MSKALRIRHASFGRVAILDLDRPLVVHAHSQAHVLIKVDGVDTSFCVRDQVMPLSQQRAVVINPWEPHSYPHAGAVHSIIVAIYLDPRWRGEVGGAPRFRCNSVAVSGTARRLVDLLYAELVLGNDGDDAYVEQTLPLLLQALAEGADGAPAARPDCSIDLLDRRLQRAVRYMGEHLHQRVDLAVLAGESGLSRPHFFDLFRRRLHMTPAVYWNMLRMECAVRSLAETQVPVGSLAAELGFSEQSNFTRFFRENQGIGPQQYRIAALHYR